jgi:hypothetical protein
MARFLKNPQLAPGATAAILPVVPSSAYGDAPVQGLIRFNQNPTGSSYPRIEIYYNGSWQQVAPIGKVQLVIDSLGPGDGTTTTFTMTQAESDATAVAVFVGGVYQQPTTNYTVNGTTTITFTSAPPLGNINPTQIIIIHNINSTNVAA